MSRLYSKATGNLYLAGVNKDIPSDAVEISDELVLSVIGNPAPGKVRAHDENGLPYLIDSPPPTVEQLASIERAWRDTQLLDTDGIINRHRDEVEGGGETTLTMEQYRSLQVYRQGLRNWPEAPIFPDSTGRPVAPTWLVEQLSE
ncbi:phage tail assembly chaperone [Pseudomonas fluorescens]|uniref:phage tail assembly chaperone n=1 Tax=Pseudomonas fluorescens TaxID=294 RepID=UPI001C06D665|nr:tail fiber assembly protein [Pseudomonas fluorescens]